MLVNKKIAGPNWFGNFMKDNTTMIQSTKTTSLIRATSFNKQFFENLKEYLDWHAFDWNYVYNVDETCVATLFNYYWLSHLTYLT